MSDDQKDVGIAEKEIAEHDGTVKEGPREGGAAETSDPESSAAESKSSEASEAQKLSGTSEELKTSVAPEEPKQEDKPNEPRKEETFENLEQNTVDEKKEEGLTVTAEKAASVKLSEAVTEQPEQIESFLQDAADGKDEETVGLEEAPTVKDTSLSQQSTTLANGLKEDSSEADKSTEAVLLESVKGNIPEARTPESEKDSDEVYHEASENIEESSLKEVDDEGWGVTDDNLCGRDDKYDNDEETNEGNEPEENGEMAAEENIAGEDGDDNPEVTEGEEEVLDDDENVENPAYIPKSPRYYMHDSRTMDDSESSAQISTRSSRADGKWSHDKFDERSQAPRSKRELVNRYGFDIRYEDKPVAAAPRPSPVRQDRSKENSQPRSERTENYRGTGRGIGRGGRGGNARPQKQHNERPNRGEIRGEPRGLRNGSGLVQQNKPTTYLSSNPRSRGASIGGPVSGRGSRGGRPQQQVDYERSNDERFRGHDRGQRDSRDTQSQPKRSDDYPPLRRGRGGFQNKSAGMTDGGDRRGGSHFPGRGGIQNRNVVNDGGDRSGSSNMGGGGGKRYSKQRTAVAYGDQQPQQHLVPMPQARSVQEIISPQMTVAAPPPSVQNPDWQHPPPNFQPQRIRPMPPPVQPVAAIIPAAAPAAYRAPNDTVYFDPHQQMIRGAAPPQPRAKKRLEIVPPAN